MKSVKTFLFLFFSLSIKHSFKPPDGVILLCFVFLFIQGEDLALPEVPTDLVPEIPEAAKVETGRLYHFILLIKKCFKLNFVIFVFLERKAARKQEDREMLAA